MSDTLPNTIIPKQQKFMSAYLDKECALILLEIKNKVEAIGGTFVYSRFIQRLVKQFGEQDISDVSDEDKNKDMDMTEEMKKYAKITAFHVWDREYLDMFKRLQDRIHAENGDFVFSEYIRKLIKKFGKQVAAID